MAKLEYPKLKYFSSSVKKMGTIEVLKVETEKGVVNLWDGKLWYKPNYIQPKLLKE